MIVKTQKQGNSLMIAIPASFNIKENTEYSPVLDDNGTLSFIPIHKNIFNENPDYDLRAAIKEMGLKDNGRLVGKEDVW